MADLTKNTIEIIDLYCGAGGESIGFEAATVDGKQVCKVVACVNHDPMAIKSHAANFPDCVHLTEDVRLVNVQELPHKSQPDNLLALWASLECTEYSKAKNGPKNADSRTLPLDLYRYIDELKPDYIFIENVEEFMSWGDLDERGVPKKRKNGRFYLKWVQAICDRGYRYQYRLLNAADYGQHTKRIRYFGMFAKGDLPIVFPKATHTKNPEKSPSLDGKKLKKWRPVLDCLDLSDPGQSVFNRPRPLVDKTLKRLLKGLQKFKDEPLIMHCNSPGYCSSTGEPCNTLTKTAHKAVCLMKYYGNGNVTPGTEPADTLTKKDRMAVVKPWMMQQQGKSVGQSVSAPLNTLQKTPKHLLCQPWIFRQFSNGGEAASVNEPAGSVLKTPKLNLCQAWIVDSQFGNSGHSVNDPCPTLLRSRRHFNVASAFIVNPQYNNKGNSVHEPCPVIVASQRSNPLGLAVASFDGSLVQDLPGDTGIMLELKAFCRENGIADITMRMLKVPELKAIQGFGKDYVLEGTVTQQKAFIGQSVCPAPVKAWMEQLYREVRDWIAAGHQIPVVAPLKKANDTWMKEVFINSATVTGLTICPTIQAERKAVQGALF